MAEQFAKSLEAHNCAGTQCRVCEASFWRKALPEAAAIARDALRIEAIYIYDPQTKTSEFRSIYDHPKAASGVVDAATGL